MNILERFKYVKTFVFDIDGVLTDGTVLLLENGLQARTMNIKDGLALQMAIKNGFNVLIISGSYSEPVIKRLQYLGLSEIFCAIKNKQEFLDKYFNEQGINWEQILFMGDDLPDITSIVKAGIGCCPNDAVQEVKDASDYISPIKGGGGCVRDVIEKVLRLNQKWNFITEITSR